MSAQIDNENARPNLLAMLPKGTTLYISGPMSNLPEENLAAFTLADTFLKEVGFKTINPHVLNKLLRERLQRTPTYYEFLREDMIQIATSADGLYMLEGWWRSPGAQREMTFATWLGIPIFYEHQSAP